MISSQQLISEGDVLSPWNMEMLKKDEELPLKKEHPPIIVQTLSFSHAMPGYRQR